MNAPGSGISIGGNVSNTGDLINHSNNHNSVAPAPRPPAGGQRRRHVDLGVLAILPEETHALVTVFERAEDYRRVRLDDGTRVHEATFVTPDRRVTAVLMQTMSRGQRSAAVAYGHLRHHYTPPVVALVGIAGAIDANLAVGDVVIADQVIYYDETRVAPEDTYRRGEATAMPAGTAIAVRDLFTTRGGVFQLDSRHPDGTAEQFTVVHGPIGSGGAVITDAHSKIRTWLQQFHQKTLAVETEAGGLVQAFHEDSRQGTDLAGWLVVRGISDHADPNKGHRDHATASRHAAQVLEVLVQFL